MDASWCPVIFHARHHSQEIKQTIVNSNARILGIFEMSHAIQAGCAVGSSGLGDQAPYQPDPTLRQGSAPEQPVVCRQVEGRLDRRWGGDFPWSIKAKRLLQDFFGSRDFRHISKSVLAFFVVARTAQKQMNG